MHNKFWKKYPGRVLQNYMVHFSSVTVRVCGTRYKIDNKKKVYVCKNTFGICIRCADRNEAELYPPLGVCTLIVCTSLVVLCTHTVGWVFTSALAILIEEPGTRSMNVHTIHTPPPNENNGYPDSKKSKRFRHVYSAVGVVLFFFFTGVC